MKNNYFIILLLALAIPRQAYSQADSEFMSNILSKLKTVLDQRIQEKVYLQFDKPFYAAGDTVYFKAYLTMGERHEPSAISGILYVDLIDAKNNIKRSVKVQVSKSVTWADFELPDSLVSGNYHIRAYTRWMQNDPGSFFDKVIPIAAIADKQIIYEQASKITAKVKQSPDVQFFPEGGNLVAEVRSNIAFKAVGVDGLGIDVSGAIVDNEHNEVAKIKSDHLGMGVFSLLPEAGRTYKARLTFADGSKSIVDLPAPEASGITMAVYSKPDKISIEIKSNRTYYKENLNKDLNLVIYGSGLARTIKTRLDNEVLGVDLPVNKFKTGILRVTLFSQTSEPLSERIVFLRSNDLLKIGVSANKVTYKKRDQVQLSLQAQLFGTPVAGSFSVSVVNEDLIPDAENKETTILSDLLLSSELKGYVEQSNYYFADTTADARHNLDILMLTQGYRRFNWKQLIDIGYPPLAYQPEKHLDISGMVQNGSGNPVAGATVSLLPAFTGPVLSNATDGQGIFRFANLVFTDTMRFILNAASTKETNLPKIIYFNQESVLPIPNYSPRAAPLMADTMALTRFLINEKMYHQDLFGYFKSKGILLKEVDIKDSKRTEQYNTQSLAGAGHADQVIHADDIKFGGRLADQLNGRLRGVFFDGGVPYLNLSTSSTIGTTPATPMLVVVDGVEFQPTLQPNTLTGNMVTGFDVNFINISDVETVEVLRNASASIYGMNGGSGVLVITTKSGGKKIPSTVSATGVLPITLTGYYKAREFYSPKYDKPDFSVNMRDLRSTIYWKPDLITDKDGNASVNYFNADGTGTYRVIVEGMDEKGNLGRQVFRYKVE
jgi:TonB-dependent SusC/RagA subfamily outer membrane receptor